MGASESGMPAVSVIVPVYNVERYVEGAIRSLQAQTFGDFEAICVDDGSTDGSAALVRALTEGDGRFRVLRQDNAGPASARNRGFAAARGTYLMCLDADDTLAPDALARLHARACEDDLDVLDFSAEVVYESRAARSARNEDFYAGRRDIDGVMTGSELFCAFERNREFVCALWLHFFKRELLEREGLRLREGMYVHEDELFSPLLLASAPRAAFMNEALYIRRVREGSAMTAGRGMRNVSSMYEVTRELHTWAREHADELDGALVAALAQRIAELRALACEDAARVPADELMAFAAHLPAEERLDFELDIVQGALSRAEFYGSTTWRAGEALLALPKALKVTLGRA